MELSSKITFELTIEEVDQIFDALQQQPFSNVCQLEQTIEEQVWRQFAGRMNSDIDPDTYATMRSEA